MDPNFDKIARNPENEIFKVVFYPDRIYHAEYLNATVSKRYQYNVKEVRNKHDITIMKAQVFMDGQFLANVLRIEYHASRLNETVRTHDRFLQMSVSCKVALKVSEGKFVEKTVSLGYCNWVRAYQCEIWDNLEPVQGAQHQYKVLSQIGKNGSITQVRDFNPLLSDLSNLNEICVTFYEHDIDEPFGYTIGTEEKEATADNDYFRSYQVPNTQQPSAGINTVEVKNYLLNFQRGWFLDTNDVAPVRYENAMMEPINPSHRPTPANSADANIVEMRWILQRELGSSLVYFHHVTVKPNSFEGIHQHIGSEELYYITSGEGIAYMGEDDDPANVIYPLREMEIFCIGKKQVRELVVKPGNVIFTKSGGIHGIRNESKDTDLTFVAFGYQCS